MIVTNLISLVFSVKLVCNKSLFVSCEFASSRIYCKISLEKMCPTSLNSWLLFRVSTACINMHVPGLSLPIATCSTVLDVVWPVRPGGQDLTTGTLILSERLILLTNVKLIVTIVSSKHSIVSNKHSIVSLIHSQMSS